MNTFPSQNMKRIGVFTSGGDAPGMNAAIRATVRSAIHYNLEVTGIYQGYQGMLDNQFKALDLGSMANVIQRGGTILKSGRCKDFHKPEARALAAKNLKAAGIQALVCIGGDGSFRGAKALWEEHKIPTIGVPGTIDNDVNGSDYTIGFDTAVNTALEAIDKIRDTAASHDRLFIVEVMGRNTGHIALEVGLAGGAEDVFFPEHPFDLDRVVRKIQKGIDRGKKSSILITAEGNEPGCAYEIAQKLKEEAGFSAKVCILGHIQRGGSPTAIDRVVASQLASLAVEKLREGHCNAMIAMQSNTYQTVSFNQAVLKKPFQGEGLLDLVSVLSQ